MATRTAQVSIGFKDSILGRTFWFEQSSRTAEPGFAWVRLHPSDPAVILSASTGRATRPQRNLRKHVERYITFNGQADASLGYPPLNWVGREVIGRLYPANGNPDITIGIRYEESRQALVAYNVDTGEATPTYGVVRVEYDTSYDLIHVEFDERPEGGAVRWNTRQQLTSYEGISIFIPATNPDDDDDPAIDSGYHPLLLIGLKKDEDGKVDEIQTFSPTPTPTSELSEIGSMVITNSSMARLALEIDPNHPPSLSRRSGLGSEPISATCGLLLYPNCNAVFSKTAGEIVSPRPFTNVLVTEVLSWNGSPSAKLKYQPSGSVSFTPLSETRTFFDKWGYEFTPRFVTPGKTFNAVEWVTANTYKHTMTGIVQPDEIIVCDSSNSVPAYGVAEVTYLTSFRTFTYVFEYDSLRKQFMTAYVAAKYGEQFASLQLTPPTLGSVF